MKMEGLIPFSEDVVNGKLIKNRSSNSVFPCRSKTVGTKVHAFSCLRENRLLSPVCKITL